MPFAPVISFLGFQLVSKPPGTALKVNCHWIFYKFYVAGLGAMHRFYHALTWCKVDYGIIYGSSAKSGLSETSPLHSTGIGLSSAALCTSRLWVNIQNLVDLLSPLCLWGKFGNPTHSSILPVRPSMRSIANSCSSQFLDLSLWFVNHSAH
jgi:hypothetical protein